MAPKSIVLITGANSGIGFEAAKLFAAQPDMHVLLAARTLAKADAAAAQLRPASTSAVQPLALELTAHDGVSAAAARVAAEHGRVDMLVNNAGVVPKPPAPLAEQFRLAFETNTLGQVVMTEAFRPLLAASARPRLVFLTTSLSSIANRFDPANVSYGTDAAAYRCSKAALNMWAACAAWAMRGDGGDGAGVPVWLLDPGVKATNLVADAAAMRAKGAGDPAETARVLLDIFEGRRDHDRGKLMFDKGVWQF